MTEPTMNRTDGGEASHAASIARNARHRDRVNRRTVASMIRRVRLFRGARECDLEAMIYTITEKRNEPPGRPPARGTEEGMEPDDLLCSRNARSRTPLVGHA